MKIYGIGTDIVFINRIKETFKRKINFRKKIFSKNEINYCNKKINKFDCYAKRFAAKEAFSKALGTGISNGIKFNEITIDNNNKGKPILKTVGITDKIVKKTLRTKKFKTHLSLSDDTHYAIATVILEI